MMIIIKKNKKLEGKTRFFFSLQPMNLHVTFCPAGAVKQWRRIST